MTRKIEPFARNNLMGDIRRFAEQVRTDDHKTPSLSSPFNAVIASPSFDKMYLEYIEGMFEDFFEANMPLEDLLESCYKEDITTARNTISELKEDYPNMFTPAENVVLAEGKDEEAHYKKQYYDQALSLLEIINIMDKKTADPAPSEREKEAASFVRAVHEELGAHLEKSKRTIDFQTLADQNNLHP